MHIESFEVKNFKSIKNSGIIDLSKINVFIGPNSSGKSSLLQSLLLMKQTFEVEVPNMALVLNGPYGNFGEYSDFIHNKSQKNNFEIVFNFREESKFKPYVCDICGREYVNKSWYKKHVIEYHKDFWDCYKDTLLSATYHDPRKETLRLQYKFNEDSQTVTLSELELKNPLRNNGLILSSIILRQDKNKVKLELISLDNKVIYSKEFDDNADIITHQSIVSTFRNNIAYIMRSRYNYMRSASMRKVLPYEKASELISLLSTSFAHEYSKKLEHIESEYNLKVFEKSTDSLNFWDYLLSLQNLPVEIEIGLLVDERIMYLINSIETKLDFVSAFLKGIHHVGALRSWPERIYFGTGGKPNYVGVKGEYTQEIFWLDKRIDNSRLISNVNQWLDKLNFNIELDVDRVLGDTYQLKVKQNGLSVNISDVGFGVSQFLPILAECLKYSHSESSEKTRSMRDHFFYGSYKYNAPKSIISEEPEIHLNPKIQAKLADLFIEISKSDLTFFIETHSEHIISRIQRRVADNSLNPNDVNIYYISLNDNESEVKLLKILENGTFEYWPEDFFQEDYEDSFEILKASMNQSKVD